MWGLCPASTNAWDLPVSFIIGRMKGEEGSAFAAHAPPRADTVKAAFFKGSFISSPFISSAHAAGEK